MNSVSATLNSKATKKWHAFVPKSFVCLFLEPYRFSTFRKDVQAGVTVGVVALPLAMAFAIASGVGPEKGIFTAIIAGFIISLLGGSRVQIGGPTGAFVVIVYGIVMREGYGGLIAATLIAAVLLVIMGLARMGTLIRYIPYPLVTGFTTGIALMIFSSQVKDFLGLKIASVPADFLPKWASFYKALPTLDVTTCGVAMGTLGVILLVRRFVPQIPWGLAAIVLSTIVCWGLHLPVETIATRFGEIPRMLPMPSLPDLPSSLAEWQRLIPDAITIAFLAGIESLLSAVVADGMTGGRHKSNCELVAQGAANLGSCFFGGIPATGAIARTATNVKTGATTPVAGMVHAVTLLLILLVCAPLVGLIPMAALSAVLVVIAWNMSELGRFRHLFRAPVGDIAVLLTAFVLTVLVDLTVAVEVGMILAAFLFMKRVSTMAGVVLSSPMTDDDGGMVEEKDPDAISRKRIPSGVEVYEIQGPLFFGIADSLQNVLPNMERPPRVFILRMRKVPEIDATGLHALEDFYDRCTRTGTKLVLSGVTEKLARSFKEYGIGKKVGAHNILPNIDLALQRADELVKAP